MVYITLFLLFFYLKIARVHTKQEKVTLLFVSQHTLIALSALATLYYGFITEPWYFLIPAMWFFFIIAALMVTAMMVGIFIDGIALVGLSRIYRFLPLLTLVIVTLSTSLWVV
ncbi:hypothetical protein [Sulfurimonas marina]|uniref:DUF3325 domain-containing protein n=1 Tax=Sulfurimonas marina TaxID=2590551 RepID=A0A7M1AW66_9BACT|nr:hypothetical protein [Sulfurimonas marina]QOP41711.1 hypothetical protein FJR03_08165 [Sulfurimonas marina]